MSKSGKDAALENLVTITADCILCIAVLFAGGFCTSEIAEALVIVRILAGNRVSYKCCTATFADGLTAVTLDNAGTFNISFHSRGIGAVIAGINGNNIAAADIDAAFADQITCVALCITGGRIGCCFIVVVVTGMSAGIQLFIDAIGVCAVGALVFGVALGDTGGGYISGLCIVAGYSLHFIAAALGGTISGMCTGSRCIGIVIACPCRPGVVFGESIAAGAVLDVLGFRLGVIAGGGTAFFLALNRADTCGHAAGYIADGCVSDALIGVSSVIPGDDSTGIIVAEAGAVLPKESCVGALNRKA